MILMAQQRTYLDTNIIADRKLREKEAIAKIESVICQTYKYCSAFVVSEHKKTFLKAMRFLWTIFNEKKKNEKILDYIKNKKWKSSQQKDRYKKLFKWITEDGKIPYIDALKRLETMIFLYDFFFFGDIDVLESEVNCPLAGIQINSREDITAISISCPLKCTISDFLKNQKNNLIILEKKIKKIKHMGLIAAILQRVIKNPDNYDEDVCRTLADVIIVIEAPDDFLICSNNKKHFDPICTSLGKRFHPIYY